jgi:hypothetical protein
MLQKIFRPLFHKDYIHTITAKREKIFLIGRGDNIPTA